MVENLKELSIEILLYIFRKLDSIRTLLSVVLTCKAFHNIFHDNKNGVVNSVTINQIPAELWPFIYALLDSNLVATKYDGHVQDNPGQMEAICTTVADKILTTLTQSIQEPAVGLSQHHNLTALDESFIVCQVKAMNSLRGQFIEDTIPNLKRRLRLSRPAQASLVEKFRIERALLRYQLMCNLHCIREVQDTDGDPFFNNFSPWVNEQLLCVYAFLARKVRTGKPIVHACHIVSGT